MRNEKLEMVITFISKLLSLSFLISNFSFLIKKMNNRYKTNKKWKKDCTVQPMSTMRVA